MADETAVGEESGSEGAEEVVDETGVGSEGSEGGGADEVASGDGGWVVDGEGNDEDAVSDVESQEEGGDDGAGVASSSIAEEGACEVEVEVEGGARGAGDGGSQARVGVDERAGTSPSSAADVAAGLAGREVRRLESHAFDMDTSDDEAPSSSAMTRGASEVEAAGVGGA